MKKFFGFICCIIIMIVAIALFFDSNNSTKDYSAINYEKIEIQKMIDDLSSNALAANDTYKNKYVEVYGEISTIDASGDYISLIPKNGFVLDSIHCSIKNDELLEFIKNHNSGDCIIARGQVIDVGEILGYTMEVHSFTEE